MRRQVPASAEHARSVGVTNRASGLDRRLVLADTPTGGLVCRYGGLNDLPPFTLTAHHLFTKNAARRLANLIDGIPVGPRGRRDFLVPTG